MRVSYLEKKKRRNWPSRTIVGAISVLYTTASDVSLSNLCPLPLPGLMRLGASVLLSEGLGLSAQQHIAALLVARQRSLEFRNKRQQVWQLI